MKKTIEQLPDQIKELVIGEINEKVDCLPDYTFDLEDESGWQQRTIKLDGVFHKGCDEIGWEAKVTLDIKTYYERGDYFSPSWFDIEDKNLKNIELLEIYIDNEETFIEYKN